MVEGISPPGATRRWLNVVRVTNLCQPHHVVCLAFVNQLALLLVHTLSVLWSFKIITETKVRLLFRPITINPPTCPPYTPLPVIVSLILLSNLLLRSLFECSLVWIGYLGTQQGTACNYYCVTTFLRGFERLGV